MTHRVSGKVGWAKRGLVRACPPLHLPRGHGARRARLCPPYRVVSQTFRRMALHLPARIEGRAAAPILAAFRPLFCWSSVGPTGIPSDHAYRLLASRTKQARLVSRTKGCAPNASSVECSGEVKYPKFDFLLLQPDSLQIGMRVAN